MVWRPGFRLTPGDYKLTLKVPNRPDWAAGNLSKTGRGGSGGWPELGRVQARRDSNRAARRCRQCSGGTVGKDEKRKKKKKKTVPRLIRFFGGLLFKQRQVLPASVQQKWRSGRTGPWPFPTAAEPAGRHGPCQTAAHRPPLVCPGRRPRSYPRLATKGLWRHRPAQPDGARAQGIRYESRLQKGTRTKFESQNRIYPARSLSFRWGKTAR